MAGEKIFLNCPDCGAQVGFHNGSTTAVCPNCDLMITVKYTGGVAEFDKNSFMGSDAVNVERSAIAQQSNAVPKTKTAKWNNHEGTCGFIMVILIAIGIGCLNTPTVAMVFFIAAGAILVFAPTLLAIKFPFEEQAENSITIPQKVVKEYMKFLFYVVVGIVFGVIWRFS